MHLLKIPFFVLVLVSLSHDALSQSSPFNTLVLPIMKDANTSLHKVSWWHNKPKWDRNSYHLIDLDAPFSWTDCVMHQTKRPCLLEEGCRTGLYCEHSYCKEAQAYANPICPSLNITKKYGCELCPVTVLNPISNSCKISQISFDLVDFYLTDGRNPYAGGSPGFKYPLLLSCAPSYLTRSFPKNVHGVAAFSWSNLAFPRQLYAFEMAHKFTLCLSSSTSVPGVTFLGEGPFYFTPSPNLDLRTVLSYTPMIRRGLNSLGYSIIINQITIKGKLIQLQKSLNNTRVKLSTIVPYTTLRSDIYKALLSGFSNATKHIPRVNAVKPFSLCLKASAIGSVRTGFRVPNIGLVTESGNVWTISGDNSMKRTGNGAACLAFIDGGSRVKYPVVIGTFQMENNFLFFDLAKQKLGFSSSILPRGTPCGGFNFTEISI